MKNIFMDVSYLETEEIVKIHNQIIKQSGGHDGIINYGNLDFVVSQMETTSILNRKAAVLSGTRPKLPTLVGMY